MTWKDFVERAEELGVRDDDEVCFIDVDYMGGIEVQRGDGGVEIRMDNR